MYELDLTKYKDCIVVWYNPNLDKFYYKFVYNFYTTYYPNYTNQYGHVVIMVIKLKYYNTKTSFLKKLIRKFISLLNKIDRRL